MRILQVFNRYRDRGGEEKSAERIFQHASEIYSVKKLWWDSRDWDLPGAPGKIGQLRRMFCNPESAGQLREAIAEERPDAIMCHNLYPVGSPSVYREALAHDIPVIQYIHNFRPYSVSGTLWTGNEVAAESLNGNYMREVLCGSWQGSVVKSALFALMLKRLHASGWLEAVKLWIAISDFMRDKFVEAGIPPERIVTLRHSWDAFPEKPVTSDDGYYLFLGRLVPEKGVRVLLDAWRVLSEQMGDKTPVLKIAGVGREEELVRQAASNNKYIDYVGYADGEEKRQLIAGCRAMLAPSVWWEPLGLVTYEAYDFAKPMLAAASGGLTETIQDGMTGLVFEPEDTESLCDAVRNIESLSTENRARMGAEGRKWLLENASPEAWKSRYNEYVQTLLKVSQQ